MSRGSPGRLLPGFSNPATRALLSVAQGLHYREQESAMDKRLEEQLERVRRLTARVTEIHEQLAHNTALMTRDREHIASDPLSDVRDFRAWHGHDASAHTEPAHVGNQATPRARGRRRSG
jgi:hypothetical protein